MFLQLFLVSITNPYFDKPLELKNRAAIGKGLSEDIKVSGEGPCAAVDTGTAYCPSTSHADHAVCECYESPKKKIYLCIDAMLIYRGGGC